jgi:hypothetical protein
MFLPGKNVVWVRLMTFVAIWEIIFVATLVNILRLTFSRHVGLYCYMVVASLHFGSRITVQKFKLYKCKSPL